jgi:hypothetical protein
MSGSDRGPSRDYERAVVVEREVSGTNKTTPGSGGRSLLKKGFDRADIVRDEETATLTFEA